MKDKQIFEKKVGLSGPHSPFLSRAPPIWPIFDILCSGGRRDLIFTSNDAECPSLYPTYEDTIALKSLVFEKMTKNCFFVAKLQRNAYYVSRVEK